MLPEAFDPRQAARSGERFAGSLPLSRFHRLTDLLVEPAGEVAVALSLETDDSGRPVVGGVIRATLGLICQRCLEPMTVELRAEPRLVVVAGEDLAPEDGAEHVLCGPGERLALAELVEDELILGLPVVALHGAGSSCAAPAAAERERRSSPFAVLKGIGPGPGH